MSLAPATKVFEQYSLDKVFYYTLPTKEITFASQNMDVALVGKSAHVEVHSRGVELVEEDVEEEGEEEGDPAGGQHGAHLPRGEGVGCPLMSTITMSALMLTTQDTVNLDTRGTHGSWFNNRT